PVVQAAPLECVVDLEGAVAGGYGDRGRGCGDPAEFADRDGRVGEYVEHEDFEIAAIVVDLVDEQHARAVFERLQEGPGDQETPVVETRFQLLTVRSFAGSRGRRLDGPQVQDLARKVPVVQCLGDVQAFIALQPDEVGTGGLG